LKLGHSKLPVNCIFTPRLRSFIPRLKKSKKALFCFPETKFFPPLDYNAASSLKYGIWEVVDDAPWLKPCGHDEYMAILLCASVVKKVWSRSVKVSQGQSRLVKATS